MSVQNVRVPGGDIAPRHWQGGPLDCAGCGYVRLRELPAEHGCGPASHAGVFCLPALLGDPDEMGRLQLALRLPQAQLARLIHDPHREVRIRVAQRLSPAALIGMRGDADASEVEVRRSVAERLPATLLSRLAFDRDWRVRWQVARRAAGEIVASLMDDADEEVRALARRRRRSGEVANLMTTGQTQRSAGVKHG
ncbi:LRV iron-sulfur cluster protein [Paraburkholderia sp. BL6665CI2N2]|uniref:4Fe4S-binding leucine-rich repeat protein n=1 Tax=Paraburkholderia sp. BL6665CI2N2 TaxID=1938806 RepID=UPI001064C425|nr:4Fe4S-binding leucine-rich repeat protein [Paraburkholderia sp. BL6665CI2N2]TDY17204.1 LRV iron-sulfur cluster protein [Paraburkholderia sp. BL6665CI2N2]